MGVPVRSERPCAFSQPLGEAGAASIFSISVEMHGERAREKEVVIDSTVQEKNVTYPTDAHTQGGAQSRAQAAHHRWPLGS